MVLDGHGDLAAAELAFYAPALLISLFVLFRHGFSKQLGWIYLVILALLRIIGASCQLAVETEHNNSQSLLEAAAITSSIGTAPLLNALSGFLQRINEGMELKGLSKRVFTPIQLLSLAALILAIVGGTNESSGGSASSGRDLLEAASILFITVFAILAGITLFNVANQRWVDPSEKTLLRAGLIALPFLLVRVVFTVCVSFAGVGTLFYFFNVNVWAQAFMQFLMEAVIVTAFIVAGLLTPRKPQRQVQQAAKDTERGDFALLGGSTPGNNQPRRQQPRSLGDYRPSRLIMNAIRDRK